ncbi:MAG: hypothetical protein KJZ65_06655 [Phycisphaerales bacterium]|nr:hypothetical protein [Phycisphaerales bacterium]
MSAMPNNGLRLAGSTAAPKTAGYVAPAGTMDELRRRRRVRHIFRDLHSGRWSRVLLDLQMSQHRYRDLARHSGKIEPLLAKVNFFRLANSFHATVTAGNPVNTIVADGFDEQSDAIDAIRTTCLFDTLLMEAVRAVNIDCEAPLRVSVTDAGTVITQDDPDQTLPVGPAGPDGQPTVWERRWIVERKDAAGRAMRFLRVERHRVLNGRGVIEQEAYKASGDRAWALSDVLVDLDSLVRVEVADAITGGTPVPPDMVETGASYPAIVQLVADRERGEPMGKIAEHDLDIIDESAAAFSRMSRAHDLHSTPLLRVSEQMVDKKTGKVQLGDDGVLDPEKIVEYIAQGFDLGRMLEALDRILGLQLVMLRMSQALLGFKMGGGSAPDSYEKLRLEGTNTLAWARQTTAYCAPALGRLFTVATQIDARLPLRGYAVAPVTVEMRPELPKDRVELVREVAEERRAGLLSLESALTKVNGANGARGELEKLLREEEEERRRKAEQAGALAAAQAKGKPFAYLSGEQLKVALEIVQGVDSGKMAADAALGLLVQLYGFDEDLARRMVASQADLTRRQEMNLLGDLLSNGSAT